MGARFLGVVEDSLSEDSQGSSCGVSPSSSVHYARNGVTNHRIHLMSRTMSAAPAVVPLCAHSEHTMGTQVIDRSLIGTLRVSILRRSIDHLCTASV